MTQRDLQHRLVAAYAVDPPQGFSVVDKRLSSAMLGNETGRWHLGRGPRVMLGLAVAFLLLAGVTAGAITVLDRIAGGTPGTQVAWDRGVEIGQREVHGDFAVALVRGYADINGVVLGLSVERAGRSSKGDVPGLALELRDPAGTVLPAGSVPALGALDEAPRVDEVVTFAPTTRSDGDYTLRLGFTPTGKDGDLPWSFRFQLPAPLGAVVHLDQAQVVDGTSIQVGTLRLSPTALTAAIHVDPAEADASAWGVVGSFRHGDTAVRIDWNTLGSTDLDLTAGTYSGVDDAAGKWTLTVTELVGDRPDGSQVRLQGPWQFTFEVAAPTR
ncbi:MAG TPA: hypothetical protein VIK13_09920 [Candidatus Limnocylindrales bacterium]|jgi:hypothetical protein